MFFRNILVAIVFGHEIHIFIPDIYPKMIVSVSFEVLNDICAEII